MEKWIIMGIRSYLDFTPAESIMLLDPQNADEKKMISLTFTDLLLRDIIKIEGIEDSNIVFSEKRIRIVRGENYSKIPMRPHESAITDCVPIQDIWPRDLAMEIFRNNGSPWCYKVNLLESPLYESGYLKKEERKFLFIIPYYKYLLSDKGMIVSNRIRNLLERAGGPEIWLDDEPIKGEAYLAVCASDDSLRNPCYPRYIKAVERWVKAMEEVNSSNQ